MKLSNSIQNLIRKAGRGFSRFPKSLTALLLGAGALMSSCSMVNEELPECAELARVYTIVNFKYDYNMRYTDLFQDHVGSVYLYVFDSEGVYLYRREKTKVGMEDIKNPDFSIMFDDSEIKPGHTYQFVAIAQGNHAGYDASLETPGFQIPEDQPMIPGVSHIEDYRIKLDRDDDGNYDFGIVNYKDAYGNNTQQMDTIWSTKPDEVQIARIPTIEYVLSTEKIPDTYVEVLIPMMRITNAIRVNLIHDSFTEDFDVDAYIMLIDFPNGNGTIDFTGTTYPVQELFYRSLRKQMVPYQAKQNGAQYEADPAIPETSMNNSGIIGTRATTYAVQADFGVSRMQTTDGSSLQIRNARDNSIIVQIDDFAAWLADYFNNYFDDPQELLDREYNFTVDIHLDDNGQNDWIQVGCAILGWGKRIYYYDL
ncbi:MAG: FimB/Mfa2 family fimbrial subunit [Muribaculaceae bacterium]|nr:FimB/Mfa2 family fimbrial subunit [Muribaculaceae bacterium]